MDTMTTTPMTPAAGAVRRAGFWARFGATIVDGLIMAAIRWPISLLVMVVVGMMGAAAEGTGAAGALATGSLVLQLLDLIFGLLLAFFYAGWFYKNKGATPGKMLFKLKVVDAQTGMYLGYGRTFLREIVGKFISAIILMIGYLMAAFREDKRALHDLMVGSQVIRRD